jgi:hypothetical protein
VISEMDYWLLKESELKRLALQAEAERDRLARRVASSPSPARVALADGLRALANSLDPRPLERRHDPTW